MLAEYFVRPQGELIQVDEDADSKTEIRVLPSFGTSLNQALGTAACLAVDKEQRITVDLNDGAAVFNIDAVQTPNTAAEEIAESLLTAYMLEMERDGAYVHEQFLSGVPIDECRPAPGSTNTFYWPPETPER